MRYEWDSRKADSNLKKHGIDFADAALALEDDLAMTISDVWSDDEERFITIGVDPLGRVLVVVYSWRGEAIRVISARRATARERRQVRATEMKNEYDFSEGKRGAVVSVPTGKTRITIRLDDDVIAWFKRQVHEAGGGSYQSLINAALREHVKKSGEPLEDTLRRVIREELSHAS